MSKGGKMKTAKQIKKEVRERFDKMMGNPLTEIDGLIKQARELNNHCKCGGIKLVESEFCKDCI